MSPERTGGAQGRCLFFSPSRAVKRERRNAPLYVVLYLGVAQRVRRVVSALGGEVVTFAE